MKNIFWNDALKKGAILGFLMLVSKIFEQQLMRGGTLGRIGVVGLETVIIFILFVYLTYRFTKSFSQHVQAQREVKYFTFGEGFTYVVMLCILTGVITGFGGYFYTHFIVGYENQVQDTLRLYENLVSSPDMPASLSSTYAQLYDQLSDELTKSAEPSLLRTIYGSISTYLLLGAVLGLILAAIVKQSPYTAEKSAEQDEQ